MRRGSAIVLSEAPRHGVGALRWALPLSVAVHAAAGAAGLWLAASGAPRPAPVVTVEVVAVPGAPDAAAGQADRAQDAPDQVAAAPQTPVAHPADRAPAGPAPAPEPPDPEPAGETAEAASASEPADAAAEPGTAKAAAEPETADASTAETAPPPPAPAPRPRSPEAMPVPKPPAPPAPAGRAAESTDAARAAEAAPADGAADGSGQAAAVPGAGASSPPRYQLGSGGNPVPDYPWRARRAGWEGRVVVAVAVRADGGVAAIDVVKTSGHPVLDDAAVEAIRRWRFEPAKQAGMPVAGSVEVPITFKLVD